MFMCRIDETIYHIYYQIWWKHSDVPNLCQKCDTDQSKNNPLKRLGFDAKNEF